MVGPAVPIVRAVLPDRQAFVNEIIAALPDALLVTDRKWDAMDTFLRALETAGRRPALHLEDDVSLAPGFRARAAALLNEHQHEPVQLFSIRAIADRRHGARWELGSQFLMGQCFYLPAEMSRDLRGYADYWRESDRGHEHPTGLDLMVADFLRERRIHYWHHVPSLVQHRPSTSLIDHRRARTRQSPTFEDTFGEI